MEAYKILSDDIERNKYDSTMAPKPTPNIKKQGKTYYEDIYRVYKVRTYTDYEEKVRNGYKRKIPPNYPRSDSMPQNGWEAMKNSPELTIFT